MSICVGVCPWNKESYQPGHSGVTGGLGVSAPTEQCKTGVWNVSAHLNHLQWLLPGSQSTTHRESPRTLTPAAGSHRGQWGVTLSTVLVVAWLKETDPHQMPDLGLGPPKLPELPVQHPRSTSGTEYCSWDWASLT